MLILKIFRLKDRKGASHILSPTHEEEITSLVASAVKSYKDLPIRLYQICTSILRVIFMILTLSARKYRDEARPRHGLLRSREFVMKDLYTFDLNSAAALATYYQVREAYARLFAELKLPYIVAEADSGSIGGYLSHEFHFPTSQGEDRLISCMNCDYVANEELAESPVKACARHTEDSSYSNTSDAKAQKRLQVWRGVSRDRRTLINVWYPAKDFCSSEERLDRTELAINPYAVSAILPDLDTSVVQPTHLWEDVNTDTQTECMPKKLVNLVDCRLSASIAAQISSADPSIQIWPKTISPLPDIQIETITLNPSTGQPMNLMRISNGDSCPCCSSGSLVVRRAIELGHTFHLGTRYSKPMGVSVAVFKQGAATEPLSRNSTAKSTDHVFLEMGCHGIGVTRIIGAVADSLADEKGLNWPRVMAPFEVVVIALKFPEGALKVYDALCELNGRSADRGSMDVDVVLDDRENSFGWKMQDADLVGYPVIVVVGRRWKEEMVCEVQCRRLKIREEVHIGKLLSFVKSLLVKL